MGAVDRCGYFDGDIRFFVAPRKSKTQEPTKRQIKTNESPNVDKLGGWGRLTHLDGNEPTFGTITRLRWTQQFRETKMSEMMITCKIHGGATAARETKNWMQHCNYNSGDWIQVLGVGKQDYWNL